MAETPMDEKVDEGQLNEQATLRMEKQEESKTEPTKPPLDVFNAIDPFPMVQHYIQVNEQSKEMGNKLEWPPSL